MPSSNYLPSAGLRCAGTPRVDHTAEPTMTFESMWLGRIPKVMGRPCTKKAGLVGSPSILAD